MEKTENVREIDGYRVILEKWGQYRVENPISGKYVWEQLNDEVDYANKNECWEQIEHDIHDQNPDFYLGELGDPSEKETEKESWIENIGGIIYNLKLVDDGVKRILYFENTHTEPGDYKEYEEEVADNGIATLEDRARGLHADLKETDWNL